MSDIAMKSWEYTDKQLVNLFTADVHRWVMSGDWTIDDFTEWVLMLKLKADINQA